ncbi:MAG TPA: ATP-binding protein [Terriglobales bacterium]|nr:ATP-binding protein [Terriglobales bacterium]
MPSERPGFEAPPNPPDESRHRRRDLILLISATAGFLVLLVLETMLPEISDSKSPAGNIIFFLLINLNLILLGLLAFLLTRNLVRLVLERRRGIFGSRLRTRLVLSFVGLALVPSAFLFFAAQVFLNSAFESWFNVRIERALENAMQVTQSYYQFAADNAVYFARAVADDAGKQAPSTDPAVLERFADDQQRRLNVGAIELIGPDGGTLARSEIVALKKHVIRRSPRNIARVLAGETTVDTLRFGKADIVRVAAPVHQGNGAISAVLVDYYVPRSVSRKARAAGRSYAEYRQLAAMKQPIENQYILTLALITLVLIFSASWVGFQQAKSITVPLQRLEEGTREVAQGNWAYRIDAGHDEETGVLVDSFNQMTADLEKINAELNERRKYLESILGNITAGVVSLDARGNITTVNRAAELMLGVRLVHVRGKHWSEAFARSDLEPLGEVLQQLSQAPRREATGQLKLAGVDQVITVLASATNVFADDDRRRGAILFLENVTHLLRVERMEAWREVARQVAHEIKNPLTPIQLSAQRVRKRYAQLLSQPEGALLDECTRTIISQVDALKRLVSEFSNFARLPPSELARRDLNELAEEALALFREGHPEARFALAADPRLPLLELDGDAIKRALVNMVDNALAACEGAERPAQIAVATRYDAEHGVIELEVADNGAGMRPETKMRLFEPYFSTKKHGTGLGLAIVSSIVADHHAYIRVYDNRPAGTRFVITFPVREPAPRAVAV